MQWFVLCTRGLSALAALLGSPWSVLQHHSAGTPQGQPGHPTGTAGVLPPPKALLPKRLAALGMPSAVTASASGSAGSHWRKRSGSQIPAVCWEARLGVSQDETSRCSNTGDRHMAWTHW